MGSLLGALLALIPALLMLYVISCHSHGCKKGIMEAYDEMNLRDSK